MKLFKSTRHRYLILLVALLIGSWPTILQAGQPNQEPHTQAPSSFLLVATQEMRDPRFRQAVLLVTSHGSTGPIGVIVNRPLDITLDQLFPDYPSAKNFNLFDGGPVYPKQISYLVRNGEAVTGALKIDKNIYLAYDPPVLEDLLSGKRKSNGLRVMHGMASWAPGQLEYEIKLGGWLVLPFDETIIFDHPPAKIWEELNSHVAVL